MGLALAILVELLVVVALLTLGVDRPGHENGGVRTTVFFLPGEKPAAPKAAASPAKALSLVATQLQHGFSMRRS